MESFEFPYKLCEKIKVKLNRKTPKRGKEVNWGLKNYFSNRINLRKRSTNTKR